MVKVTLDAETFKALASATRLTVLRTLDERRKTLTELAKDLDLNKATVHEHLQLLTAAGLVKKCDDEGRKWIYYELTWRGEKILHPQETTTFNVLLGLGVAAAGGGVAMLGRTLGWWLEEQKAKQAVEGSEDLSIRSFESNYYADTNSTADDSSADAAPSDDGSGAGSEPADGDANNSSPAGFSGTQDDSLALRVEPGAEDTSSDKESSWTDDLTGDDGIVALALIACALLFAALAFVVRRKLRPEPGRDLPPELAAAEARGPNGP